MWRPGYPDSAAFKGSHCDGEKTLHIINRTQFKVSWCCLFADPRELLYLSSCAHHVAQRCQIFSLEAFAINVKKHLQGLLQWLPNLQACSQVFAK